MNAVDTVSTAAVWSSFAFSAAPNGDKWRKEGAKTIRELHDVDLYDVSVVTYPAYTAADATVRSLNKLNTDETAAAAQSLADQARAQIARRRVLVSDLRRSRLGWWLAWVGTRILTMSPMVHFDGPVSVDGPQRP